MFDKEKRELPPILKMNDIKKLLRCSAGKAYEIVYTAEKTGAFPVIRLGKSYRVPRDPFLEWLATPRKNNPGRI
ncbi:MAG: hypothetical protein PWQ91_1032 [Eubacteriales bacterium]|nr:hypothetical protein [Eubacteriales bacterium]